MSRRRKWHKFDVVPSYTVPADMASGFKRAGYKCWSCGWFTPKTGYAGRQSIRGHLRRHAFDRKAWQRPLVVSALLFAFAGTLAWLGELDLIEWPGRGYSMPSAAFLWLNIAAIILAVIASARAIWPGTQASPALLMVLRGSALFAAWPAVLATASRVGVLQGDAGTAEYVLAALSAMLAAWLATTAGSVRWLIRRRARTPEGYVELSEAKTFEAEMALEDRVREQAHGSTHKHNTGKPQT